MNAFPSKNCSTCGNLTKFKCHCAAWGYPELYFCSYDCKKDHLREHITMNPAQAAKRKITENDVVEVKKPTLKLSSFTPLNKKKSPSLSGPGLKKAVPGYTKSAADASKSGTDSKKNEFLSSPNSSKEDNEAGTEEYRHRDEYMDENVKENIPKEKKIEKGPVLIISVMTDRQKTRKTNDIFKMIQEALGEMKMMRPAWNIVLKTDSTNEEVKIKKNWLFSSRKDVNENAIHSRVKRRFTRVVQGLRVIEAIYPHLMFELKTDKPKGTGKSSSHQYVSDADRPEIVAVEDVSNIADDVETNVEMDQDDEEHTAVVVNNEEIMQECRVCKLIIQKEEVALFCGTAKKLENHFGCHVRCLGFYKVEKGDKFLKDLCVHYRCPEHSD